MSNPPPNAWQTAGRSRNSNSASRTPQSRSGTQSPNQQPPASQIPRQEATRTPQQPSLPSNSVWAQRSLNANISNGPAKAELSSPPEEAVKSVNGFNAAEVRSFLGRDASGTTTYKPAEVAASNARNSGTAWDPKPSHMANGQLFFIHLSKQVTTVESGG